MVKILQTKFLIILLILLTIPTFWTMIRPGFFPMQDDLQAFRVFEMDKCFQDFQIPCRWVPDMGYQYGYPQFNFYSPSVFYLGEVFHLFGLQFIDSVKLLFILGFILSALTMFLFLQSIFGRMPAFFGALLYTYVPFKAVQVYVRGSLSEFWALVIFPLLFWSSYQFIKTKQTKYGLFLAGSICLMLTTHNLLSILILPVLAVWCLVLLKIEKRWKMTHFLISFGLLGLGLASFFILPALFEKQYVHTETLLSGYFDYRQHFVSLQKLFLSNEWGYGSSNLGQTETLNLSTGIVQWICGIVGLLGGVLFFKKDRKLSFLIFFAGGVALLSLFMIHQKSSFIWAIIPGLNWLQFPWRFLSLSTFFLSFLGAASIYYLQFLHLSFLRKQQSLVAGLIFIIAAISLAVTFYHPKDWYNISDKDKFSGQSWEKQLTISIFDYLPIFAKLPPNHVAPAVPESLEGDTKIDSYSKSSNHQNGFVITTNGTTIRLPLFDFPGMETLVDIKQVSHSHDNCTNEEYCLGLITMSIPPGYHAFSAQLTDTPIRTLGNSISLASLLLLIGGFFYSLRKI